jgi:hypothetical protein
MSTLARQHCQFWTTQKVEKRGKKDKEGEFYPYEVLTNLRPPIFSRLNPLF